MIDMLQVCNPHAGNHSMTYPPEFEQNVIDVMEYLDTQLPYGSHVFFIGLEDGPQWEYMAKQMHPLNVTYATLWEFLSCYDMNPCWVHFSLISASLMFARVG